MAKRHLTARQLRFLHAKKILRSSGKGKNRKTTYDRDRAAAVHRLGRRGVKVNSRRGASRTNASGRHVFGEKAAHLRSGAGGRPPQGATKKARALTAQHRNALYVGHGDKPSGYGGSPVSYAGNAGQRVYSPARGFSKSTGSSRNIRQGTLPGRAGRFRGSLNGRVGELTRGERITLGNRRLETFIGQQGSIIRQKNNAGRKEMSAKFPGKYADTGKPFGAGERIYYADRTAYSRPGSLSLRRSINWTKPAPTRTGEVRRAAAEAARIQFNVRGESRTPQIGIADRIRGRRAGRNGLTSSALTASFKKELKRLGLTGKGKAKSPG
ncbi:hypothetical protein [Deinococcus phoenicis]|uniref:hypothetical protein n=1 Tax=Deinococcus phoenicis TaxID=1476583 RepID=UPI001267D70C|nr:hypothetical protein [Deinococcus phoenicis]